MAMRHAILLPAFVALGTVALIAWETSSSSGPAGGANGAGSGRTGATSADYPERGPLDAISTYRDPEIAFDMAIPAGWTAIVGVGESAEAPADGTSDAGSRALLAIAETGRVVGFEAPRDGADDAFADYVMVEILPGRDSGQFLTDGSRRRAVRIDGHPAYRDGLRIEGHEVDGVSLDLIVHQAELRGVGWTIGFYAIGEPSRARLVEDAFELMIGTFRLRAPPFRISRGRADGAASAAQRVG